MERRERCRAEPVGDERRESYSNFEYFYNGTRNVVEFFTMETYTTIQNRCRSFLQQFCSVVKPNFVIVNYNLDPSLAKPSTHRLCLRSKIKKENILNPYFESELP